MTVRLETTPVSTWSEIVAPASGQCRRELPESVTIAGGRTWAFHDSTGTSIRTGSSTFLSGLARACFSRPPLAQRLTAGAPTGIGTEVRFNWATVDGTAQVEEELTPETARGKGVFAVPLDAVASWALELRPGVRPWQPIRAYWVGRSAGVWRAAMSVEAHYAEQGVSLHDVYYRRGTG